jgi:endonuclease III-like uncharacterized protein
MYSHLIQDARELYQLIEDEQFYPQKMANIKSIVSRLHKFSSKFVRSHDFLNLCLVKEKFSAESIKAINHIKKEVIFH